LNSARAHRGDSDCRHHRQQDGTTDPGGRQDGAGDPADRFIAATAVVHDATLMTANESLLAWRAKVRRQNAEM